MSPIAVEGLSLPLDIPAPVVTSPPAARGGESFQDHLRRAGSRDDARPTSSPPAEDRSPTSNVAATAKPEKTSRSDDDHAELSAKDSSAAEAAEGGKAQEAKTDSASKAEQGDEQVDAHADKTDADGKQSSSDDEHAEKKDAEAIAAAAAAVAALKEAQTGAPDEITLSDEALDEAVADTTPVAPAEKPKPGGEERGAKTAAAQVDAVVGEAPQVDATVQPSAETEQQIVAAPQESASVAVVEQPQVENTKHAPKPAETPVTHVAAKDAAVIATESATTAAAPPTGATAELPPRPAAEDDGKQRNGPASTDGAAPVQANGATPAITAQVVEAAQAAAAQSAQQLVDSSIKNDEDEKSRHADQKIGDAVHRERTATQADRAAAALETAQPATRRENSFTGEAAGGERAGSLSHAERARLVQRVTRAVTTAHERGGDLKIRLSPPELGSLKLQVKLTDGVLSARLEAETPQARQVIAESLPQLRERLAEQNIRVERFDVDLMNSGGGGLSNMPDRRQDGAYDGPLRTVGSTNAGRGGTTETTTRGAASNRRTDGGLDLLA